MSKPIDWNGINESNALIHKEGLVNIMFIDNGKVEIIEIIDSNTEKIKDVKKYFWKVIDISDKQEKEYSTLSMTLLNLLKPFNPLKNKTFQINKYRTGNGIFDVNFEIKEVK